LIYTVLTCLLRSADGESMSYLNHTNEPCRYHYVKSKDINTLKIHTEHQIVSKILEEVIMKSLFW